ncbi:RNA-binding domain-containing protein [Microcoleus sp. MON1_C1]|uniref:RNA-binding domain-containing protein n=1 Tax=Microcoleus sp. MON1_C1 TaxID=2818827 RepID=UPI002FD44666
MQGQTFPQEEGDSVEFKEIKSQRPVNTIVNHAEQYVVGFLNAQIEGYLYLGIDDSGIIQGVTLNRNDRDEIGKNIPNKLRMTDPPISPYHYIVTFHDVLNVERKVIEDLYVLQIHVIKTEEDKIYLYKTSGDKTSGGSVYLKKGSTCMKLNSEETAKEIERRTQVHLRKEADELDKKLEKTPNDRRILKSRAKVAKYMGDVDTMERVYLKLLELDPKSSAFRLNYAIDRKSLGDLEGALSILNDAIKSNIKDVSILNNKGLMLQELDRWDEALLFYENLLKRQPDDYTILTKIGVVFRHQGKYSESIKFLNCALGKSPNYRLAKYEKKKTYQEIFKRGNTN